MADVRPLRGIRYDVSKVGDLSLVVSPPYDVISDELREQLYAQSCCGIVRIDYAMPLPGDDEVSNRYTRSRGIYADWQKSGILLRDAEEAIYYVEEDYAGEFGGVGTRSGFMARVKVEDAKTGVYRPHEKTLAGPKADRLNLTRACRANLSPVFSLYDEKESTIDQALAAWKKTAGEPSARAKRPDGFDIRMWSVTDRGLIALINKVMGPLSFYIADGHHRYETALNYRNEMRRANPSFTGEEPWNFTLMYLVNMHSPGLTILPTHRAVFGLKDFEPASLMEKLESTFDIIEVKGNVNSLLSRMKDERGRNQAIGLVLNGDERQFMMVPRPDFDPDRELASKAEALRRLDVTLLHSLVIERILGIDERAQEQQTNLTYVKEASDLVTMVRDGDADVGFILNPTPVKGVKDAAEAGERMPQKSTFFYPKLVTGLVINPLE